MSNFEEAYKTIMENEHCVDISKAKFMYFAGINTTVKFALHAYKRCCNYNVDNECHYSEAPSECRMDCLPCAYFFKTLDNMIKRIDK